MSYELFVLHVFVTGNVANGQQKQALFDSFTITISRLGGHHQ